MEISLNFFSKTLKYLLNVKNNDEYRDYFESYMTILKHYFYNVFLLFYNLINY